MVARMIRAHGRRVGDADPEDLPGLIALRDVVEAAIAEAVTTQNEKYERSWAEIAAALGMTRSAAWQRWGAGTPEPEFRSRVAAYCLDCRAEATQSAPGRPFSMTHADDCPYRLVGAGRE
jgi:hypothetical protein